MHPVFHESVAWTPAPRGWAVLPKRCCPAEQTRLVIVPESGGPGAGRETPGRDSGHCTAAFLPVQAFPHLNFVFFSFPVLDPTLYAGIWHFLSFLDLERLE